MQRLFVPKETREGETRVAATPDTVRRLIKDGLRVTVEAGAGLGSFIADADFREAGAEIADNRDTALRDADIVAHVNIPTTQLVWGMRKGASLISYIWPADEPQRELIGVLKEHEISALAMDAIPRITRAQKDDALSSQANLAGYKAVLLAAAKLPKIFPMMTTAAGTIRPARVVVIGAGVAGLQAIATAKRLGAIVEVSDVRPEVKEQAQSLGATYIEVEGVEVKQGTGGYAAEQSEEFKRKQQELLHERIAAADVVISTALIPYRDAPKIISEQMVKDMRPGSVIVDLAAERGGNCELTKPGAMDHVAHGVTIMGAIKLEDTVSVHASQTYAKNIQNLLSDLLKEGALEWDLEDAIVDGALITHAGEIRHARTREMLGLGELKQAEPAPAEAQAEEPAPEATQDAQAEANQAAEASSNQAEPAKAAEQDSSQASESETKSEGEGA